MGADTDKHTVTPTDHINTLIVYDEVRSIDSTNTNKDDDDDDTKIRVL